MSLLISWINRFDIIYQPNVMEIAKRPKSPTVSIVFMVISIMKPLQVLWLAGGALFVLATEPEPDCNRAGIDKTAWPCDLKSLSTRYSVYMT